MMDIDMQIFSMVYKFFNKKTWGSAVKSEIMQNQQLAQELHEPIIRKFEKRKLHSKFKFNKKFRLLCVIDIYSKYMWVFPLKD